MEAAQPAVEFLVEQGIILATPDGDPPSYVSAASSWDPTHDDANFVEPDGWERRVSSTGRTFWVEVGSDPPRVEWEPPLSAVATPAPPDAEFPLTARALGKDGQENPSLLSREAVQRAGHADAMRKRARTPLSPTASPVRGPPSSRRGAEDPFAATWASQRGVERDLVAERDRQSMSVLLGEPQQEAKKVTQIHSWDMMKDKLAESTPDELAMERERKESGTNLHTAERLREQLAGMPRNPRSPDEQTTYERVELELLALDIGERGQLSQVTMDTLPVMFIMAIDPSASHIQALRAGARSGTAAIVQTIGDGAGLLRQLTHAVHITNLTLLGRTEAVDRARLTRSDRAVIKNNVLQAFEPDERRNVSLHELGIAIDARARSAPAAISQDVWHTLLSPPHWLALCDQPTSFFAAAGYRTNHPAAASSEMARAVHKVMSLVVALAKRKPRWLTEQLPALEAALGVLAERVDAENDPVGRMANDPSYAVLFERMVNAFDGLEPQAQLLLALEVLVGVAGRGTLWRPLLLFDDLTPVLQDGRLDLVIDIGGSEEMMKTKNNKPVRRSIRELYKLCGGKNLDKFAFTGSLRKDLGHLIDAERQLLHPDAVAFGFHRVLMSLAERHSLDKPTDEQLADAGYYGPGPLLVIPAVRPDVANTSTHERAYEAVREKIHAALGVVETTRRRIVETEAERLLAVGGMTWPERCAVVELLQHAHITAISHHYNKFAAATMQQAQQHLAQRQLLAGPAASRSRPATAPHRQQQPASARAAAVVDHAGVAAQAELARADRLRAQFERDRQTIAELRERLRAPEQVLSRQVARYDEVTEHNRVHHRSHRQVFDDAVERMREVYEARIPGWNAQRLRDVFEWDKAWPLLERCLQKSVAAFSRFCTQDWNLFHRSGTLRRAVVEVVVAWERVLARREHGRAAYQTYRGFR
eukprot:COSAG04_NODE_25_length_37336_cov_18.966941_6_plen_933_part_00